MTVLAYIKCLYVDVSMGYRFEIGVGTCTVVGVV